MGPSDRESRLGAGAPTVTTTSSRMATYAFSRASRRRRDVIADVDHLVANQHLPRGTIRVHRVRRTRAPERT